MKKDKKYCVYLVINKDNGKIYVGKTCKLILDRYREHWSSAYGKRRTYFWDALRKSGKDNFDVCLLDVVDSLEESSRKEIEYIQNWKSHLPDKGYNTSLGGEGVHPTEETRRKLSETWKAKTPWWVERGVPHPRQGSTINEKTRRALDRTGVPASEKNKEMSRSRRGLLSPTFGIKKTPEQKKNLSEKLKGRRLTDEWKQNISKGGKGRRATEQARINGSMAKLGDKNPMFGVIKEKHHSYRTDISRDTVCKMIDSGLGIGQIAGDLGVSRHLIQSRIEELDG